MKNCKPTCTEWCDGLKINGEEVKRNEVEKLVNWGKGDKDQHMSTAWKKLAEEAAAPDG